MKNYLEYIKESNSDEFAKIFAQISKFSNELKNSFQSTIDKNKRESETKVQPKVQPKVQVQSKKKVDSEGKELDASKSYNYAGRNKTFPVKIIKIDSVNGTVTVEPYNINTGKKIRDEFPGDPNKLTQFSKKKEVQATV